MPTAPGAASARHAPWTRTTRIQGPTAATLASSVVSANFKMRLGRVPATLAIPGRTGMELSKTAAARRLGTSARIVPWARTWITPGALHWQTAPHAPGKYTDDGVPACQDCRQGTYLPSTGAEQAEECIGCAAGKFSTAEGANSSAVCEACGEGKVSAGYGADKVHLLLRGGFGAVRGQNEMRRVRCGAFGPVRRARVYKHVGYGDLWVDMEVELGAVKNWTEVYEKLAVFAVGRHLRTKTIHRSRRQIARLKSSAFDAL